LKIVRRSPFLFPPAGWALTSTIRAVIDSAVRPPQRAAKGLILLAFLSIGAAFEAPRSVSAQAPGVNAQHPPTIWDGVYSEAQARRGEQVFKSQCSYCHKDDLTGGFLDDGVGKAPALAGKRAFDSSFVERWGGLTLADMVATVAATMPQGSPSSLTVENYVDVVTYLLSKNDAPAGATDLSNDVETLSRIIVPVTSK
jgi:S-disulfanyl-L-cysteine oxidoreductase SoxD